MRFVMTNDQPLTVERLKRVTFEGVPPKNQVLEKEINVTFKQNLPVLIRPSGLAKNDAPWEGLTWSFDGNNLIVQNPSAYVVRFISAIVEVLPSGEKWLLPQSYLLPHHTLTLTPEDRNGRHPGILILS